MFVEEADLVGVGRLSAGSGRVEFSFIKPFLIDGMLLDVIGHGHFVIKL